ncbi:MAG: ribonuclease HIII [Tenericutes bacterium]|nr:ribonuclease HIII [Mycoplasmatota bacterium]
MTITVKVGEETKKEMIDFFEDSKREKTPDYALFQAVDGDTVVTLYNSGKAVFQGKDADLASQFWIETEKIHSGRVEYTNSENKKKEKKIDEFDSQKYMYVNSVGSDEVGTGDYFGPIVVTAAYVRKEDISFVESLGIKDSKKLTDEKILDVVPKLIKNIKYKSTILSNEDYNKNYSNDVNMNKIKAILHNKMLYSLLNEIEKPDYIIVDEFAKEDRYYSYLKDVNNVVRNITFMTKAEDKNLAVACASVISRYIFIKEFDKMCDTYKTPIPKGAGDNVDKIGQELVEKYGKDVLDKIAKKNFSNTKRILKTMIF